MNLAEWWLAAGNDGIPFAVHTPCHETIDITVDETLLDLVTAIEAHECPRGRR